MMERERQQNDSLVNGCPSRGGPDDLWPSARLSFCWRALSMPIEIPTDGRGGCSRMTVSPTASDLASVVGLAGCQAEYLRLNGRQHLVETGRAVEGRHLGPALHQPCNHLGSVRINLLEREYWSGRGVNLSGLVADARVGGGSATPLPRRTRTRPPPQQSCRSKRRR